MIGAEMSARLSSPVLIGRLPEMATLSDALSQALAGSPGVVIVGGEAGIGKTRLVEELAARAREGGGLVLEGGCISIGSDDGLPYGPIAEALRTLARTTDRSELDELMDASTRELGRLVPDLLADGVDSLADAPSEWAQTRLFDGFLILLERLGQRRPVTLIVEDLHWADRSTRDLLTFVARRLRDERVLVLLTHRSDELHRRHPLRPWLAEIDRLPRVDRLELERFDRDELAAQLAAIHGRPAPASLVDQIARRSEGNPFFAEELLAAGSLTAGAILPARLRDVLLGRIGSLSEPARRLLAAVAVAGGTVDHDLLRGVLAVEDEMLAAALDEAISAQLLVQAGQTAGGSYAFRHALLGEAVLDDLLASEQRRLHQAYAGALAARRSPDGAAGASHLAALAHHAIVANDLALALRASIESARASAATSGFHEAARAFERAVALWDSVPEAARPGGEDYVELLYETAGALMTADEPARGREAAHMAVARIDTARDPLRAARLEERLAWAVYLTGDLGGGISLLEAAVDRLDGRPPSVEAAGCLAGLATFAMYAGRYHDAVPIAERAIAMSQAAGAGGREVEAMGALGSALAIVGDCGRGLSVLRDALRKAHEVAEPVPIGVAYLSLASTLCDCDALEESVTVGLEGSAWARGMRYPGFQAMAVEGLLPLGRWREARQIFDQIPMSSDGGTGSSWNGTFAGIIAVRSGRLAEAQMLLDIRREGDSLLTDAAFAGNLGGGLIELALAEGRLDDARSQVDESLAWLASADDIRFRSRVLRLGISIESEIAVVARSRRDPDGEAAARVLGAARLERLESLVAPDASETSPVFAEALSNRALARAEITRLVDRPDPGAWAVAADRFLIPRRPYELAWCRYRQAEAMLAMRAPRPQVTAVLAEARSLADEIGAEPLAVATVRLARIARLELPARIVVTSADGPEVTPNTHAVDDAPADGASDPFGLTAREREVLVLLAQGETNRRIADALFISESTASVHVSNIIGKLGVTNRVEAAAAAIRSGLAR